jgi:hypothetical protein
MIQALVAERSVCSRLLAKEHPMARYFFHVYNGTAHLDEEGTELPGLDEARQEAVQTAGEILRGNDIKAWKGSDWHMAVTNAAGGAMLGLYFSLEELSGEAL